MNRVEPETLARAIEMASGLAELINEDHETELGYLDILDYFAILGLSFSDEPPTQIYVAALEETK
ncbi:hypothetical protein N9262_02225 [Akkermansiaceae bacterium]|jgi:hypothetical protein|nr:hypothetical protein [Akkermansiaceae bacterium]